MYPRKYFFCSAEWTIEKSVAARSPQYPLIPPAVLCSPHAPSPIPLHMVSTLYHKVLYNPMKRTILVSHRKILSLVFTRAELPEIFSSLGDCVLEKLHFDPTHSYPPNRNIHEDTRVASSDCLRRRKGDVRGDDEKRRLQGAWTPPQLSHPRWRDPEKLT